MDNGHETQQLRHIRCACVISNLEGRCRIEPDESIIAPVPTTIDALNKRLRVLELRQDIKGALPTDAATWDSLAWRLSRLDKMVCNIGVPRMNFVTSRAIKPSLFSQLASSDDVSLEMAAEVIDDVASRWSDVNLPPLSKKASSGEGAAYGMVIQRLYYLAGRQAIRPDTFPATTQDLFTLAVEFSLDVESGGLPRPPVPIHNPWMRPPPGAKVPKAGKRSCCGCCSCSCHPHEVRRDKWMAAVKRKRFSLFGWVKKLACWRRKTIVDDSSSSSSIVSSTLNGS